MRELRFRNKFMLDSKYLRSCLVDRLASCAPAVLCFPLLSHTLTVWLILQLNS